MTRQGDALKRHYDRLFAAAGISLTVTRGVTAPVTVNAVKGRSFTERFGDEDQIYATRQPSDFIVAVADWVANVGGEPMEYDTIGWTDDEGTAHVMQVGVDGIERHFDPVGQFGTHWRIHTTEVTQ